MARPHLKFENAWREKGCQCVAGIDEAGVGPLAGPVCAAAVILPVKFKHKKLTDSKLLNEKQREEIYGQLMALEGFVWSVVMADVEEIDRLNILHATWAAMRRAVQALIPLPDMALIDGRKVPNFPVACDCIIKGDRQSLSIAAASVIAKVTRDRFMDEAAQRHPEYGFEKHKGYSTRGHLEALRKHGPCPLHRRSFEPVSQLTFVFEEA
jgi:ribonuclease HII